VSELPEATTALYAAAVAEPRTDGSEWIEISR
jgi:hypothetical protein